MRVRVACFGNDSRCASSQLYARSTARGGNELGFDGARCNLMRTKLGASSYTLFLGRRLGRNIPVRLLINTFTGYAVLLALAVWTVVEMV